MWRDPLLILIQLAQKNRIEQKIERLLLFQGPIQQKLAKIGLAFTISSLLIKHRLVFQMTFDKLHGQRFWVKISDPFRFGKTWQGCWKMSKRIVVEFEDFLFESCSLQNLTISDDETGRKVGPYCNSQGMFVKSSLEFTNFKR